MSNDLGDVAGRIVEGVEDQLGRKWLRYGADDRGLWVPISDLHALQSSVLGRLEKAGISIITNAAKEGFKAAAQAYGDYRPARLASAPGWMGDTFVSPGGSLKTLRGGVEDVIVGFDCDDRFSARSTLEAYLDAVEPIVRGQPLILFLLAFGFVGPLLRFAPADMQNPIIELVGETERGKTALARATSSIWGGDPDSGIGTCDSWDFARAKLDELRAPHRDGLFVLDEANKAGRSRREQAQVINDAVFRLADTSSRRRFGDGGPPEPIRQAALSTSNLSMRNLVGDDTTAKRAVVTRVLTLECDRPYGIFDSVPDGFASSKDVVEKLTSATVAHSGTAGHAFIERLSRYTANQIRRAVATGLERDATKRLAAVADDARTSKTIAMTYVAAQIAQQLGVLPRQSSKLEDLFFPLLAHRRSNEATRVSAFAQMQGYVSSHQDQLIAADDGSLPLPEAAFDRAPGVWLEGTRCLVISTKHRMAGITDITAMLRDLRQGGRLDADDGKLSKKAPRSICQRGRAYFIDMSAC